MATTLFPTISLFPGDGSPLTGGNTVTQLRRARRMLYRKTAQAIEIEEPPVSWDGTLEDLTPAFVAEIMGEAEPTHMHWFGQPADADDLVGSLKLFDEGSGIIKEAVNASMGKVTRLVSTSSDAVRAPDTTGADVGAETITAMWVGQFTGTFAWSGVFSKAETSSYLGWFMGVNPSGHLNSQIKSATTTRGNLLAVNHGITNIQGILITSHYNTKTAVYSREGNVVGSGITESLTGYGRVGVGRANETAGTIGHDSGLLLQWIGSSGEFSNFEASRLAIMQGLGFE